MSQMPWWQELTAAQESAVMAAPVEEKSEEPAPAVLDIQWKKELTEVLNAQSPIRWLV